MVRCKQIFIKIRSCTSVIFFSPFFVGLVQYFHDYHKKQYIYDKHCQMDLCQSLRISILGGGESYSSTNRPHSLFHSNLYPLSQKLYFYSSLFLTNRHIIFMPSHFNGSSLFIPMSAQTSNTSNLWSCMNNCYLNSS